MIDSILNANQCCSSVYKIIDFLAVSQSHLKKFGTQKCASFDTQIDQAISNNNSEQVRKFPFKDEFFNAYIQLILAYIRYDVDYVKIICDASTLGESHGMWDGIVKNSKFTKKHCSEICRELYSRCDIQNITAEQISSSIEKYGMNGPLFISSLASSGKLTPLEASHYFRIFVNDYVCTVDYTDNNLSENNALNSYCQKINDYLAAYENDAGFLGMAISTITQSMSELLVRDSRSSESAKITRELEISKGLAESLRCKCDQIAPLCIPPSKTEVDMILKATSIPYTSRDILLNAISSNLIDDSELINTIDKLLNEPNKYELDLVYDILLTAPSQTVVNHIAKQLWLGSQDVYEPFEATYQKIDTVLSAVKSISFSVIAEMIDAVHITSARVKVILENFSMNNEELISIIDKCNKLQDEKKDLTMIQKESIKKAQYYAASNLAMGTVYPNILQGIKIEPELMDRLVIIGAENSKLTQFDLDMIDTLANHSSYSAPISKIAALTTISSSIYEQLIGIDLKVKCNQQATAIATHTKNRLL